MTPLAAIFSVSSGLGYLLPAMVGLESMGVPSPGETALILAAVLASQHKLNIILVIVIAAASAIVGDNVGYLLGRKLGREVLTMPGPFREHRVKAIDAGEKFFHRFGSRAVFIGRWITVARIAVAWLAGIDKMAFPTFFIWNALGGISWAAMFGLVGYYGGQSAAHVITKLGVWGGVALGVVAAIVLVLWLLSRRYPRIRAALDRARSAALGSFSRITDWFSDSAKP